MYVVAYIISLGVLNACHIVGMFGGGEFGEFIFELHRQMDWRITNDSPNSPNLILPTNVYCYNII